MTREVRFQTTPPGVVRIDTNGVMVPLADGKVTVLAKTASGASVSLPVVVEKFKADPPINFANQVVPIFTKSGCNRSLHACPFSPPTCAITCVA